MLFCLLFSAQWYLGIFKKEANFIFRCTLTINLKKQSNSVCLWNIFSSQMKRSKSYSPPARCKFEYILYLLITDNKRKPRTGVFLSITHCIGEGCLFIYFSFILKKSCNFLKVLPCEATKNPFSGVPLQRNVIFIYEWTLGSLSMHVSFSKLLKSHENKPYCSHICIFHLILHFCWCSL